MTIQILPVIVAAIVSMVVGSIWYGPLFGKKWMRIMGAENCTKEQLAEAKKNMWKSYLLQFALSLFTLFFLANFVKVFQILNENLGSAKTGMHAAFLVWLGFIMPIEAGMALWSGKPRKIAWTMFAISASSQLVIFLISGAIFGTWF